MHAFVVIVVYWIRHQ